MRRVRAALAVISLNNVLSALGFGLWSAIFTNFAVKELSIRPTQMGLIQSVREIPGLMGFLVGTLALVMTEMRIASLSIVLLGAGVLLTAFTNDMVSLLVVTFVPAVDRLL